MRGELILHVIHITGTRRIDAGIYSLSGWEKLGGMIRKLNPLQFVALDHVAVVRSTKLDPWILTLWEESLIIISTKDWF